jgi:hypothetical protein
MNDNEINDSKINNSKINNNELRNLYLDRWFKLYEFCKIRKDSLNTFELCCTITSQYLLTLLSDGFNIHNFSNRLRTPNDYYIHYVGKEKYNLPIPKIYKTLI